MHLADAGQTTEKATIPSHDNKTQSGAGRLVSVDALRGFDMFWIVGGDIVLRSLYKICPTSMTQFLATQVCHSSWNGFRFYDLIMPLFLFIVGISLVFSLTKGIQREGRKGALLRIFRRGVLLYVLGIFYNGGLTNPWPDIRLSGVLHLIAVSYVVSGLLFCFFRQRVLAAVCVGLLVGYWSLITFVPIRDIELTSANLARLAEQNGDTKAAALLRSRGNCSAIKNSPVWAEAEKLFYATTQRVSGVYEPGRNVSDHFDFQYLPGRKFRIFCDAEGILQTIPTTVSCLLGVLAGLLLQSVSVSARRKVVYLLVAGIIVLGLGWLWGLQCPPNKTIRTPSFVLIAGGYSAMLLAVFYLVVDVWQRRTWCQPFVWIGMNAITIYLAYHLLDEFRGLSYRLAGGDVRQFFDAHVRAGCGDFVIALVCMALSVWFVRFLYQKKIFLRV